MVRPSCFVLSGGWRLSGLHVSSVDLYHGAFGILGGEPRRDQGGKLLQLLIILLRIQVALTKHEKQLIEAQRIVGTDNLVSNFISRADQHVRHLLTKRNAPLVPEPLVLGD